MKQNKLLDAYKHLFKTAKETILKTESKSWRLLGEIINNAEEKHSLLVELSKEQLEKVKEDLQDDIKQVSEHLNDIEQGVDEFISMDGAILEDILLKKCTQLADPTQLTILRIRMLAAMED
jgi:hypothetical protein